MNKAILITVHRVKKRFSWFFHRKNVKDFLLLVIGLLLIIGSTVVAQETNKRTNSETKVCDEQNDNDETPQGKKKIKCSDKKTTECSDKTECPKK